MVVVLAKRYHDRHGGSPIQALRTLGFITHALDTNVVLPFPIDNRWATHEEDEVGSCNCATPATSRAVHLSFRWLVLLSHGR